METVGRIVSRLIVDPFEEIELRLSRRERMLRAAQDESCGHG